MSHRTADPHTRWMSRALALARRGTGRVEPNPKVGAVLVKGRRVVAEGAHLRFGGLHAEAVVLRKAGPRARGATLYVTLEPCNHHGKTPPCTEAVLRAGIRRVVIATRDPNPIARGGLEALRKAGVKVTVGPGGPEARELNRGFESVHRRGRPWILAKWAMSLDGKIATRTGDSKWITSEAARREARKLRTEYGAVAVGIGTVLKDDPRLFGEGPRGRKVVRIVFDSKARLPLKSQLVRTARQGTVIDIVGPKAAPSRRKALERRGVKVLVCRARGGRVDLTDALGVLAAMGVQTLMVEGGASLLGALFRGALPDEAAIFVGPQIVGDPHALGPLSGAPLAHLSGASRVQIRSVAFTADGLLVRGPLPPGLSAIPSDARI